jgi:hypothetical protein
MAAWLGDNALECIQHALFISFECDLVGQCCASLRLGDHKVDSVIVFDCSHVRPKLVKDVGQDIERIHLVGVLNCD